MAISPRRRLGFTLVELLVVITIIGMLVALLLPAVQNARERGRQLQCLNNIRNLATATFSYDTTKGQVPGLSQIIKRGIATNGKGEYATVIYNPTERKFVVTSVMVQGAAATAAELRNISGFSWATMLLSKIERSDIWDSIVSPPRDTTTGVAQDVLIPAIDTFVCPSDRDVTTQPDVPGLSYSGNSGGWDPRASTGLLDIVAGSKGDTAENGVFQDMAGYERVSAKAPKVRLSNINDGSGTTLLFAENIHKSYEPTSSSGSAPAFGWLAANTEQQLGFVWVVPLTPATSPVPGNTVRDQEAINRADAATYQADIPRYARPASAHSGGVNTAFCDGHADFLRDDIDYKVYQQLMTPWGRKCVDPSSWTYAITTGATVDSFRNGPPLADKDWK